MHKILAIDGGGVKGIYPAAFLSYLEESLAGEKISDYFFMVPFTC